MLNPWDKDYSEKRIFYHQLIVKQMDEIWDIVLFDGEEIINCCAIPKSMYDAIIDQICFHIADDVMRARERFPYNDFFNSLFYRCKKYCQAKEV